MSGAMTDYTRKFDGTVLVAMAILITLSLAGVIGLNKATAKDCNISYYTYCGEQHGHGGHH